MSDLTDRELFDVLRRARAAMADNDYTFTDAELLEDVARRGWYVEIARHAYADGAHRAEAIAQSLEGDLRTANRNTATATEQRDAARAEADRLRVLLRDSLKAIHGHHGPMRVDDCHAVLCRRLREEVNGRG